ncbi:MAG: RNA methyltransferase [Spirochaetia bacterium]|jgi:tRNA G18 (ribose-2'-O)-methylase SpoU|nr:RNA methyltransferase [Spirochaetia bacterium]
MIDPRDPLSAFAGLRDRDYARSDLMVCEGRIVIEKALACGVRLRSMLCVQADEEEWQAISAGTFSVFTMSRAQMAELLGFSFHRGTLALADRPVTPEPDAIAPGPALALWNVTDPDNLGALIRSAVALGASRVYMGPGCADPYGRKALRASMACALGLPLVPVSSIDELRTSYVGLDGRGKDNLVVAAALVPGALDPRSLVAAAAGRSITLILGNEGWGLPDDLVSSCDERVIVPMSDRVDSLNVGAAGAILMWELFGAAARFDF